METFQQLQDTHINDNSNNKASIKKDNFVYSFHRRRWSGLVTNEIASDTEMNDIYSTSTCNDENDDNLFNDDNQFNNNYNDGMLSTSSDHNKTMKKSKSQVCLQARPSFDKIMRAVMNESDNEDENVGGNDLTTSNYDSFDDNIKSQNAMQVLEIFLALQKQEKHEGCAAMDSYLKTSTPSRISNDKISSNSLGLLISYSLSINYHAQSNATFRKMVLPYYFQNESTLLSTLSDMKTGLSLIVLSSSTQPDAVINNDYSYDNQSIPLASVRRFFLPRCCSTNDKETDYYSCKVLELSASQVTHNSNDDDNTKNTMSSLPLSSVTIFISKLIDREDKNIES